MANTQSKIKTILESPRITEKSAQMTDARVYTFNVAPDATKSEIAKEIKRIYKVVPTRVNIAKAAAKKTFIRGRRGVKNGVKKAYVFLKDGDKINIM